MNRANIILTLSAPPLAAEDLRPLRLLELVERNLPQDRLDYGISPTGVPIKLEDREAFLLAATTRAEIPLICNGIEDRLLTVSGHAIPAALAPGRIPYIEASISLPATTEYVLKAPELLISAAECLESYYAVGSPSDTAAQIGAQIVFPWIASKPPLGLPPLLPPQQLTIPHLPQRFGWVNYWSAETTQLVGFPAPGNSPDWFAQARRTNSQGWFLALTDAPLDLNLPDHLERLKEVYRRFPMVGRK